MDGLVFHKLLRILDLVLSGSKLNSLTVDGNSVYMSFYNNFKLNLCFRCAPTPPALFLTGEIAGESPGAMAAVAGASVSRFFCNGYERSGFVELKKRRASGKLLTYKGVFEPAGNYANFFLLDENDIILYSLSSRTIDPDRNIGAGNVYCLPKPNKKFSLTDVGSAQSFSEFAGFYPVTAKYGDMLLTDFPISQASEIVKKSLDGDDFFYIDKNSKTIPFEIENFVEKISWEQLGKYFKQKDKPAAENDDQTISADKIRKFFTSSCEKYLRLAEKLEIQLKQAKDYERFGEEALLIKNNIYKIKGAGDYVFEKYSENGVEKISYSVAYGEDMTAKSDKLFKKSARLKRSVTMIEERLEETLQMALSAEEQIYYAQNITDKDELYAFEKLVLKNSKKPKQSKDKKAAMEKPFYERAYEGFIIYAGRSSYSNHELVFKFGKDSDVWFHGRNFPSAHVLLRLDGGVMLSDDMILRAAAVTAALSKMKNEKRVEIDYTFRKYVNNPKNTPAGFVTYKKFKTVTVEPYPKETVVEMFKINKD